MFRGEGMMVLLWMVLIIAIVIGTHFIVTYLIENNVKIIGVLFAFIGVTIAILLVQLIISSMTDFVADELGMFYKDK
ncbi:hypothetical protein [Salinicoccus sp. CNSTN-B1]